MIIVLIGYMASGKTSVGRLLAEKMGYSFIDLDKYIEEKENRSITLIFQSEGEIYFRNKETQYLNEIIKNNNQLVLSLGGGTPCYSNNMDILLNAPSATTIYLNASINTLVKRLQNERDKRPLISHLKTKETLSEFIAKHMFERAKYYNEAEIVIRTDNYSESDIVESIILKLF